MADDIGQGREETMRLARKSAAKRLSVDVRLLRFLLEVVDQVLHNSANQVSKLEIADDLEREMESLALRVGNATKDALGNQGGAE